MPITPIPQRSDEDPTDYEQLRKHLARPHLEHPVARSDGAGNRARPAHPAPAHRESRAVSVVEWLLAVGHAVARRWRRAPRSAMTRLHPPE